MEQFTLKTKVSFGDQALERLSQLPYQKVLVVTDHFLAMSPLLSLITAPLQKAGISYYIFDDVKPDPPVTVVAAGVECYLRERPDALLAVGGGSAIDTAKGMKQILLQMDAHASIPFIAIPSTSGTGSEVTSFAVISDPEANKKFAIKGDYLVPDEAILDASLVLSVPANVTADTGIDVFTHALEAYVSSQANPFTDALAEKSASLVSQFLIRSYHDEKDIHARTKMHNASCLAGFSFNAAGLGLNHAMAHQLGAVFHIPHGRANGLLLCPVIKFNTGIDQYSNSRDAFHPCVKKYVDMAKNLGLSLASDAVAVRSLTFFIEYMLHELHLPKSMSEYGKIEVSDYFSHIDEMAEKALKDTCLGTNPRAVTKEDVVKIYQELW